jgi:hypothetical protein
MTSPLEDLLHHAAQMAEQMFDKAGSKDLKAAIKGAINTELDHLEQWRREGKISDEPPF